MPRKTKKRELLMLKVSQTSSEDLLKEIITPVTDVPLGLHPSDEWTYNYRPENYRQKLS